MKAIKQVVPCDRPLLFASLWVPKVMDGTKTQTRRLIDNWQDIDAGHWAVELPTCPHGRSGDRLWCREAFLPLKGVGLLAESIDDATYVCFRDGSQKFREGSYHHWDKATGHWPERARWRPSIHMPRWACRSEMDVVTVRPQRLQDMTLSEAKAEGITEYPRDFDPFRLWSEQMLNEWRNRSSVENFAWVWDQRNKGVASWAANPWVWVVEFARAEGRGR